MRVTICIPTVGRIGLLREALDSVRAQTYRDFDVLIGDNSVSPEYHRAVDTLVAEASDISIRVVRHVQQLSMCANGNALFDAATGDAAVYFPDDDLLCPEFLAETVPHLAASPDLDFVFADHWIVDANGRVDGANSDAGTRRYGRAELNEGLLSPEQFYWCALRQSFCLQTIVFRTPVIRRFRMDPAGDPIPDFDLYLRMAQASPQPRAYFVPRRLVKYRLHGGQWTHPSRARATTEKAASLLDRLGPVPEACQPLLRERLAGLHFSLARMSNADGRRAQATRHAIRAFRLAPSLKRAAGIVLFGGAPAAVVGRIRSAR